MKTDAETLKEVDEILSEFCPEGTTVEKARFVKPFEAFLRRLRLRRARRRRRLEAERFRVSFHLNVIRAVYLRGRSRNP
jgi:hypothetical protein